MGEAVDTSIAPPLVKAPKVHPDFADPTDDTVFSANDGTLFRFSSWRLARTSQVFKGMRETASCEGAQPIELDIPSTSVHCLLWMVLTDNNTCLELDLNETVDLWRLSPKFGFDTIRTKTHVHLRFLAEETPWAALILASRSNDVELARLAISSFDATSFATHNDTFWSNMTCLRHDWQSRLLPLIFNGSPTGQMSTRLNAKSRQEGKISWEKWIDFIAVAEWFNPCETVQQGFCDSQCRKRPRSEMYHIPPLGTGA